MSAAANPVALLYDDDGCVETPGHPLKPGAFAAADGRQVAGKEFLDAFLTYGTWNTLVALVSNQPSLDTLVRYFRGHPSQRSSQRGLLLVPERDFLRAFFPTPPASVLYTPCPPDVRYAWARQHGGPGTFALCGVTHTLCSQRALEWLCDTVTAPFEPYDALVCTSRAVLNMVRTVTSGYADYLRDRMGGTPGVRMRLEVIPLGVDTEKFRPSAGEERAQCREVLGVAHDGWRCCSSAVCPITAKPSRTRCSTRLPRPPATGKVHLLVCGWAQPGRHGGISRRPRASPATRVSFVDGTQAQTRSAVWRAADIFLSLSDSIQEPLGWSSSRRWPAGCR